MTLLLPYRRPLLGLPFCRNELWRRARAVPSLDLRFADSKSLTDAVSGQNLITFTRASDATFVNSQGVLTTASSNVPRFDHNPTTGESLGLLPEEQRTNLLLRSEEFQTTWTAARASISADATNAPNGTLTADRLIDTTDSNTHVILQSISLADSTNYAFSVFLKADQLSIVRLMATNKAGTACLAYFDLLTGTVSNESNATGLISPFPNGWYRCTILFASATGATAQQVLISPTKTAGVTFYTGNGTDGLFLWGAQLEAGAFPTSYIPTTGTAATRSADVPSITGSAFSGFYRQDQGTMFMEANTFTTATVGPIWWRFSDGTSANFIRLIRSGVGATPQMQITSGGAGQGSPFTSGILANTFFKNACYYKTDDFGVTTNGSALTGNSIDTLGTMPTGIDRLELSTAIVNCHYKRLTYWPQRLSNEVLQRITL